MPGHRTAEMTWEEVRDAGRTAFVLPPVWYTAAVFAREFPGKVDVAADTVRATVTRNAAEEGWASVETLSSLLARLMLEAEG